MSHFASSRFWTCYNSLLANVRSTADKNLRLLRENPETPSLKLKKAGRFWSVRIGRHYRALAVEIPEGLLCFWIGNHSEYERLLGRHA